MVWRMFLLTYFRTPDTHWRGTELHGVSEHHCWPSSSLPWLQFIHTRMNTSSMIMHHVTRHTSPNSSKNMTASFHCFSGLHSPQISKLLRTSGMIREEEIRATMHSVSNSEQVHNAIIGATAMHYCIESMSNRIDAKESTTHYKISVGIPIHQAWMSISQTDKCTLLSQRLTKLWQSLTKLDENVCFSTSEHRNIYELALIGYNLKMARKLWYSCCTSFLQKFKHSTSFSFSVLLHIPPKLKRSSKEPSIIMCDKGSKANKKKNRALSNLWGQATGV